MGFHILECEPCLMCAPDARAHEPIPPLTCTDALGRLRPLKAVAQGRISSGVRAAKDQRKRSVGAFLVCSAGTDGNRRPTGTCALCEPRIESRSVGVGAPSSIHASAACSQIGQVERLSTVVNPIRPVELGPSRGARPF